MTDTKIAQISELVSGLTRAEWSRVVAAVEKKFNAESAKLTLTDPEAIARAIKLEM